jgi:hypothetical protein
MDQLAERSAILERSMELRHKYGDLYDGYLARG